jgi:O-antigen ligase
MKTTYLPEGVAQERFRRVFIFFVQAAALWVMALLLAELLFREQYLVLVILFFGLPLLLLPLVSIRLAGFLLILSVLLSVPLGDVGPVPDVRLEEVLIPLLAGGFFVRYMVAGGFWSVFRHGPTLGLHLLVFLYFAVILGNYLRKPLLPSNLISSAGEGDQGLRTYYDYFLALTIYVLCYFTVVRGHISLRAVMKLLMWASLIVSLAGLALLAAGFQLSLGELRYSIYYYEYGAVRIGFLETFSVIGLGLAIAGVWPPWNRTTRLLVVSVFALGLLFSGGRAATIGLAVAVILFLVLTRRGVHLVLLSCLVLGLLLMPWTLSTIPQVKRFTETGSTLGDTSWNDRAYIYGVSMREFAKNPIFGTGIGHVVPVVGETPVDVLFLEEQLRFGGHGAYAAVLKNLGLAGFLPFVGMLVWSLRRLGSAVSSRPYSPERVPSFLFILLVSLAIGAIMGGNGSEPLLFVTLALVGGLVHCADSQKQAV